MQITNITPGARGVNTTTGTVLVKAGETVTVDVSDAEKAILEGTGWFSFAKVQADAEGSKAIAVTKK